MKASKLWPSRLRPTSPRARRLAMAAAMLGGAAVFSVSILATGPSPEPDLREEKSWPVSVIEAHPQPHSPTFTAYGRVEAAQLARVRTDLVAPVKAVHVQEGDWVAGGDVLIELADGEVRLALVERQAELAQHQAELRSIESERERLERTLEQAMSMHRVAQQKLERHQALLESRLIAQSLMEEVVAQANQAAIDLEDHLRRLADLPNRIAMQRARVERARALVEHATLQVKKTRVRAPFGGPVLAVNVAPGDRSSLAEPLVELANADTFEVRVQVPGSYGDRLQRHLAQGEPVIGRLGGGHRLTLTRLARRIKTGQSGLDAFFHLSARNMASLPPIGRVVDLRVQLPEEPDVVALPVASLYENDRIYAVVDSRLKPIQVERVGEYQSADGEYRILVRSPELGDGQAVITTQLPKAMTGLLVKVS